MRGAFSAVVVLIVVCRRFRVDRGAAGSKRDAQLYPPQHDRTFIGQQFRDRTLRPQCVAQERIATRPSVSHVRRSAPRVAALACVDTGCAVAAAPAGGAGRGLSGRGMPISL